MKLYKELFSDILQEKNVKIKNRKEAKIYIKNHYDSLSVVDKKDGDNVLLFVDGKKVATWDSITQILTIGK
jgi:hypothetical protein